LPGAEVAELFDLLDMPLFALMELLLLEFSNPVFLAPDLPLPSPILPAITESIAVAAVM